MIEGESILKVAFDTSETSIDDVLEFLRDSEQSSKIPKDLEIQVNGKVIIPGLYQQVINSHTKDRGPIIINLCTKPKQAMQEQNPFVRDIFPAMP